MSAQSRRIATLIWIVGAVLLRLYANQGGDSSIVGGLIFLVWTAPFGPVWQFWISEIVPRDWESPGFQVTGDFFVIAVGAIFWFFILPWLMQYLQGDRGKPNVR